MSDELLSEEFAEPVRQSYLMWFFSALGMKYTLLLPLAGFVAFLIVAFLLWKGKGPAMIGAIVLVVPAPVYLGVLGVVEGMMASFQVIAMSSTAPKPSEIAEGISMSLVSAMVGLVLTIPAYILATLGLVVRSLVGESKSG
ncbi:MAG: MotA/TolQ/ExbB proton channel family protein [Pirellulaceae bacterium]|nr:MotA/TolQ/ExbB proton channel family protein [Pirellulaceae bacterium]